MASREAKDLYRDLDLIAGSGSAVGLSDSELLTRFAGRRGDAAEAAFEAIVARHGPMVLGVCRGVLRRPIDADDAFQATFLVLVKKAGAVRVADSLAPWLYRVARRVAVKARSIDQKKRGRETSIEAVGEKAVEVEAGGCADALDARPILFEELDRLPEKYRSPVVLCHLEGLSHEEAARRLQWPVGTLSGRLSRARGLLRSRLARRGLGVPAAVGAAVFPPRIASAVPPALLRSTVRSAADLAAGGPLSDSILSLSQGVVAAMFLHKLKSAAIVGSVLATLAAAAGYASGQIGGSAPAAIHEEAGPPKSVAAPGEDSRPTLHALGVRHEPPKIPILSNDSIIAVVPKDRRSVTAMVVELGSWDEYHAPEGVSVTPVLSSGEMLALEASGDEVREIAAFCSILGPANPRGTWVRQSLRQPVKGKVTPVVSKQWACYQVGGDVYAFSAVKNAWDVLHLDGPEPPRIAFNGTSLIFEQGDTLYVFSVALGEWSKGLKVSSPAAK